jgi:hypothetical protein
MPIISASLRALDCLDPIAGVPYLRQDLAVECGVGQHAIARVIAFVVLPLLGLGFPAVIAALLLRSTPTQLADPSFQSAWGFLYSGYRQLRGADAAGGKGVLTSDVAAGAQEPTAAAHMCGFMQRGACGAACSRARVRHLMWWEAVVLLRKAGIVLLSVLVATASFQSAGAALLLVLMLCLQLKLQPYATPLFNFLETWSLASATATAIVSSMLIQFAEAAGEVSAVEWLVTVSLVVLNLGTLAVLGGTWLWLLGYRASAAVQQRVRAAASRKALAGAGAAADGAASPPGLTANPLRHSRPVKPVRASMGAFLAAAGAHDALKAYRHADAVATGGGGGSGSGTRTPPQSHNPLRAAAVSAASTGLVHGSGRRLRDRTSSDSGSHEGREGREAAVAVVHVAGDAVDDAVGGKGTSEAAVMGAQGELVVKAHDRSGPVVERRETGGGGAGGGRIAHTPTAV